MRFPRRYGELQWSTSTKELHGFGDASENGYAAIVYNCQEVDGEVQMALLASKTKVAPMKATTLP